jgi:hypothetical protein
MPLKVKNRAQSTLASGISDSDLSMSVQTGEAANFPTSFPFHVTIEDEIVRVTANPSGDTFTIERGAEDTTPAEHASDTAVSLNVTAGVIESIAPVVEIVAGDTGDQVHCNTTEQSTNKTSDVKLKETKLGVDVSKLYISVQGKVSSIGQWGRLSLYRNGVHVTTFGTIDKTAYETYYRTAGPFSKDDLLQVYGRQSNESHFIYARSFTFYAVQGITYLGDVKLLTPLSIEGDVDLDCTNQDP